MHHVDQILIPVWFTSKRIIIMLENILILVFVLNGTMFCMLVSGQHIYFFVDKSKVDGKSVMSVKLENSI